MTNAEEILFKYKKVFYEDGRNSTSTAFEYDNVLEIAKEIASIAFRAGMKIDHVNGKNEEQFFKEFFEKDDNR